MKLLFIYGPPAVGKFTVGTEIAARTGFRLFHNHLTVDAVKPIFEFGTEPFGRLVSRFRLEVFAEAADRGLNLVFTYCFAFGEDEPFVDEVVSTIESRGGEVNFVLLRCGIEEHVSRVEAETRSAFKKIRTREELVRLLNRHRFYEPVPNRTGLVLDTDDISADRAAEIIIDHFDLNGN